MIALVLAMPIRKSFYPCNAYIGFLWVPRKTYSFPLAHEHYRHKIDALGNPLSRIESHLNLAELAAQVCRVAPSPVSPEGGRRPYPTEMMVAHFGAQVFVQPL